MIRSIIKKAIGILPLKFAEILLTSKYGYCNISFSQFGEDLVLKQLLGNKKNGFYIDVGAHHPTRFSNTYLLYLKGWRGINIDSAPGSMKLFNKMRTKDINIEAGVAEEEGELDFYVFHKPALNTFSIKRVEYLNKVGIKPIDKVSAHIQPLMNILDKNMPYGQHIDFMNIDVEGLDMVVLKSNNWDEYKPSVIAIEDGNFQPEQPKNSPICRFLEDKGYKLAAFMQKTLIFQI